jgi:hypothetical protein
MKIHLGVSALAGSNGSLMDKNVMELVVLV